MSEKVGEEATVTANIETAVEEQNGYGKIDSEGAAETGGFDDLSDESATPKNGKRRKIFIFGGAAVLVLAIAGTFYWLYARQYESTDDAFIEGDIVQISPKVAAYVKKVDVKSNQFVHKGDLLVELDPSDLEVRLEQARAQLETARSQRGSAAANLQLTQRTTTAGQTQAASNVQTARSNVDQTKAASDAKQSQIKQAQAAVRTAQANLQQIRAQVPQAQANLNLAQVEFDRRQALFNRGDISRQALDQATNALRTSQAQLSSAQQQVIAAQSRVDEANAGVATANQNFRQSVAQVDLSQSQVGESQGRLQEANSAPEQIQVTQSQVTTAEAGIAAAEAAVHQAELELSYTKVFAPEDGYVTRKSVEEGQLVQVGTPLMAISQSDEIWVVANFKETQLENMQPGQPVEISVDAYPNEEFHGKVESFQAGTGSRFSMLPAENATGNYVKVVQRVPIKIVFDDPPEKVKRLFPGMSVEPTVKVR
ncbi:MAG: efflux RND transporter periplasmic adaptor subunit [Acidobacteriota bacterium]